MLTNAEIRGLRNASDPGTRSSQIATESITSSTAPAVNDDEISVKRDPILAINGTIVDGLGHAPAANSVCLPDSDPHP